MSHAVPGLGAALLTAAGSVWYVPALADLRAGADRPPARRTAALACLSGWAGVAGFAVLLLAGAAWQAACATAVAAMTVAAGLRAGAAVRHRREAREAARHWAALGSAPPPRHGFRYVFAALVASGVAAAAAGAVLATAAGSGDGLGRPTAVLAPAAIVAVFLALATAVARAARSRSDAGHRQSRH
ncbi:hypothetical protein ACYF6T_11395 [Streptomyces sp. 7R007]